MPQDTESLACRQRDSRLETRFEAPLAGDERQQVLVDWNDTARDFSNAPALLHRLIEAQAGRTPDAVAVCFESEQLTHAELDLRANRLAHQLQGLGVGPDVLVGVLVERSSQMLVALLAILKAGGAYVPLDPAFPRERLSHMVTDSGMTVLVTSSDLDHFLGARPASIVRIDRDRDVIARRPSEAPATPNLHPDHLAYVLYTSGSTGMPKGVAVQHAAIVNLLCSVEREPGLKAADTLLAVTTLSFDIAAVELFLPLMTGAKLVIATHAEAVDPERLIERMRETACTVLQATPTTWRALVAAGWAGSPHLKAVCTGEAMSQDLAQTLLPRCAELWNMYGPTETTVFSTGHRITSIDGAPPIGRPIANTQTYVLDAKLGLVPPGVVGELYIGGAGLARGYLNQPGLSSERFVPNPFAPGGRLYCTGDLARWRPDGVLECLGRTDHQVKLRGYRIELMEIEALLAQHPAVRQAVVASHEDDRGEKYLAAYFTTTQPSPDLVEQLRALLRTILPEYIIPPHFVALEDFPLTPNGKVDRNALPVPRWGHVSAASTTFVAPRNDLERSLATAWERVLGVPRVGIADNFFDHGATSLSVHKFVLEVAISAGIEISLPAVFRFPTISGLAESLGSEAARNASVAVPLQREGAGSPVFCLCGINTYLEFAKSLGPQQPVYGVYVAEEQALADRASRGEKFDVSIERLATSYVEAIVRAAPNGPYRLAGFSFGGILAVEAASILRQRGAEVELVMVIDTILPHAIRRNWARWTWNKLAAIARAPGGQVFRDGLARFLGRRRADPRGGRAETPERALELLQSAFDRAINNWNPPQQQSFDFEVALFRSADHSWGTHVKFADDYGWRRHLRGRLRVVPVNGDHLGIIQSPHVADLGQKAQQLLGIRSAS